MFLEFFDKAIHAISLVSWILFIVVCLIWFVRILFQRGPVRALRFLISLPVLLTATGLLLFSMISYAIVFIAPEKVAVVPSVISPQGIRPQALSPGFHLIVPFIEDAIEYPIYWQTYTMSSHTSRREIVDDDSIRARTSDGQEVFIDCSVIFRIDPNQAVRVHVDWQRRYRDDFLRPLVRGEVRTQISQFTVEEVNSSARKDIEGLLNQLTREELFAKGFILDQFILRDVSFSPEYSEAIERKQVALEGQFQRQYEAEQLRLLAAGRADALLIEAEAQAKAFDLIGKVLALNPEVMKYHYIERLAPNIQAMLIPTGNQFILPLPTLASTSPLSPTLMITNTATLTPTLLPTLPAISGASLAPARP